ncbi:unnamed protein product [Brassica rapa]|uniref:Uncharacterized protein n=1 Tax=Brassica campestris TaxID=3711 RepID=A0A3P6CXG4_BRACM|nr:unnamed protein product [Brassica rapa]VDD17244.1 unnamed protein product [Brassica rapa]
MLQLSPPTMFTSDLNKGKGVVFDFDKTTSSSQLSSLNPQGPKLMASAISADYPCRQDKLPLASYQSYHQLFSRALLR